MENNAPGRLKLKVTGILYIIQAAITILLGLLALAGGTMFLSVDGVDSSVGSVLGIIAGIVGIVIIVSAAYSLIVGILGVKNSNKPEKCGRELCVGYYYHRILRLQPFVWNTRCGRRRRSYFTDFSRYRADHCHFLYSRRKTE